MLTLISFNSIRFFNSIHGELMHRSRLLLALLTLALLLGCASANVTSSFDRSKKYQVEQVYIVSEGPLEPLAQRYAKVLSDKLTAIYVVNDIHVDAKLPTLHQANEPTPMEKISQGTARPNILICSMTKVTTNLGAAFNIEMRAAIFSKETNRYIWTARIESHNAASQGPGIEMVLLDEIARKTIDKLREDGFLSKRSATASTAASTSAPGSLLQP
jgi:hypothetical protein